MSDVLQHISHAVADRYRVEREIGAGGMAIAYLAHDLRHERQVALKALRPEIGRAQGEAIMIAPVTTSQPAARDAWIEVVPTETDARGVGWSPDGAMLYFVSARDGTRCLYAQRINRSSGTQIARPIAVHHFHGARNLFRGSLGSVLSTGPGTAISHGFFFYDLSNVSSNVWTMR